MPTAWRVELARGLAWALLLGGWITITVLADRRAPSGLLGLLPVALWLLALGGFASLIGRLAMPRPVLRGLLVVAALVAARALVMGVDTAGSAALWPLVLAWALLVALASATVRGLRQAVARRPGPPVRAAAAGALLAWAVLGDPADPQALAVRAAAWLCSAALLLVLLPRRTDVAMRGGCRAGLFDCSLPAWPAGAWRDPAQWPLLLGALVMLPMMAGLPQMLALCRAGALGPQAVLGLHLAAMFLPALLLPPLAGPAAARACGALLVAGGAAVLLEGAAAWWWVALVQGGAWSIAWSAQWSGATGRPAPRSAPWRGALVHAGAVLALGAIVSFAGPAAWQQLPLVFAALALVALLAGRLPPWLRAARA